MKGSEASQSNWADDMSMSNKGGTKKLPSMFDFDDHEMRQDKTLKPFMRQVTKRPTNIILKKATLFNKEFLEDDYQAELVAEKGRTDT